MATNAPQEGLPLYHQRRDVDRVFRYLKSGESCSLIGIGSVGKSNLMSFITQNEVKKEHLGPEAATTLMVLLDPHNLIYLHQQALDQAGPHWPGYEIMLSRLRRVLMDMDEKDFITKEGDSKDDLASSIEEYYLNLFEDQCLLAQSGIRHLEDAVYEVMQLGKHWKIVFLFDEMEGFISLPPQFFQSLRGLRDEFKQRLMYVTASRRPLEDIFTEVVHDEKDWHTVEGFLELFHGFRYYISLLERPSAEAMVSRLEKRYNVTLDQTYRRHLLDATGCHAGLLKRSFLPVLVAERNAFSTDELIRYLIRDPGVAQECQTILSSLSPDEQDCLRKVVQSQTISPDDMCWKSLYDKHIFYQSYNGTPALALPLLGWYVLQR